MVQAGKRVGRVGEAALFAHLLKKTGRGAASENRRQRVQGVSAFVFVGHRGHADDDGALLDGAFDREVPALRVLDGRASPTLSRRRSFAKAPSGSAQRRLDHGAQRLVVGLSGGCDHQLLGPIVLPVVAREIRVIKPEDALGGSADRPAQRMPAHDEGGDLLMGDLGGVVGVHRELFKDDAPLHLHVGFRKSRGGNHVREQLDGVREVLLHNVSVIVGQLLSRAGVEVAAEEVDAVGELLRAARGRTLEKKMLEKVRGAERPLVFIGGPCPDPEADGDGVRVLDAFGQHPNPARKHRAADEGAVVRERHVMRTGANGKVDGGKLSHPSRLTDPAIDAKPSAPAYTKPSIRAYAKPSTRVCAKPSAGNRPKPDFGPPANAP